MLDNAFSFIMNYIMPPNFCRHLSDVDKPVKMSIDELKNFNKMTKLQKADYIKKNDVTYIEQKLSELDLDEYQYNFITKAEL